MDKNFIIEDSHFEYLYIQKGDVSDAFKNGFDNWKTEYINSLEKIYDTIIPVLPDKCKSILDVGSGLGGIDIVLNRHYDGCKIRLLDGLDDAPIVNKHSQTFNNMQVAKDYLTKNGVKSMNWYTPSSAFVDRLPAPKYDLIVSFASYCFHYSPETYMKFLLNISSEKTVFIFDVRRNSEWEDYLNANLQYKTCVYEAPKFRRMVFNNK